MSVTDDTIAELERTLSKLKDYRAAVMTGDTHTYQRPEHAAACRATMDLTRQLAIFRRTPTMFGSKPK